MITRIQQNTNFQGFRNIGSPKTLAKTPAQIMAKAKAQSTKMGRGDSIWDYASALVAPVALAFLVGVAFISEQNTKPGTEGFNKLQQQKEISIDNFKKTETNPEEQAKTLNLLNITKDNGRTPATKLKIETEFLKAKTDSTLISQKYGTEAVKDLHPTRDFVLQFPK